MNTLRALGMSYTRVQSTEVDRDFPAKRRAHDLESSWWSFRELEHRERERKEGSSLVADCRWWPRLRLRTEESPSSSCNCLRTASSDLPSLPRPLSTCPSQWDALPTPTETLLSTPPAWLAATTRYTTTSPWKTLHHRNLETGPKNKNRHVVLGQRLRVQILISIFSAHYNKTVCILVYPNSHIEVVWNFIYKHAHIFYWHTDK